MKTLKNFYNLIIGNLVILILIASTVTLITMYKNLSSTVQNMSQVMIRDRLDLTKEELNNFFQPINQKLETARERGIKGLFRNNLDQQRLNDIFIPLLKSSPFISSLMIGNEQGDEYMLLQADSIWITRITEKGSTQKVPTDYFWMENPNGNDFLTDQNLHPVSYDPRERPWYKSAFNSASDTKVFWTSPYTFFTTKQPGITASTKWYDSKTTQ